jgi:putative transposase
MSEKRRKYTKEFKKKNLDTNHKKVARLLRENGLNHRMKKKLKITTDSKHKFQTTPNILNRDFEASVHNQK